MIISGRNILQRGKLFFTCMALGALCFALAGCGATKSGSGVDTAPPAAMAGKALVYGLSVSVPQGWTVSGSADEGAATVAEINTAIADGKRIPVIDMFHPADNAEKMDARIGLFLVDATKNFMPEDGASRMTQQDFDEIAKNIIENEKEQAARSKTQSNMLEWRIYRDTIGGNLAIVQEGLGKKPTGGQMRIRYVDIYLPGGKGVAVRAMGDADVPGNQALLKSVASSIKYTPVQ